MRHAHSRALIAATLAIAASSVIVSVAGAAAIAQVDSGFAPTLDNGTNPVSVRSIAVQPDGKVLLIGSFNAVASTTRNNVARVNADGTLDTSFDPNLNGDGYSVAVQADGKILLSGQFSGLGPGAATERKFIARVNSDGLVDTGFNPNNGTSDSSKIVHTITPEAGGKILLGGKHPEGRSDDTLSDSEDQRRRRARHRVRTGIQL